jgi:hypothetical protein
MEGRLFAPRLRASANEHLTRQPNANARSIVRLASGTKLAKQRDL